MTNNLAVRFAHAAELEYRAAGIIAAVEAGFTNAEIITRFSMSPGTLRSFLSKERQRRHLNGLPTLRETRCVQPTFVVCAELEDEPEDAPAPTKTADRVLLRSDLTDDGRPEIGADDLPGFAAWELVHGAGLPVRDVVKKLGLRYPSEVFELLAKHKRGLDGKRLIQAEDDRVRQNGRTE